MHRLIETLKSSSSHRYRLYEFIIGFLDILRGYGCGKPGCGMFNYKSNAKRYSIERIFIILRNGSLVMPI